MDPLFRLGWAKQYMLRHIIIMSEEQGKSQHVNTCDQLHQ